MRLPQIVRLAFVICAAFGVDAGQEMEKDEPESESSIDHLYTEMEVSILKFNECHVDQFKSDRILG